MSFLSCGRRKKFAQIFTSVLIWKREKKREKNRRRDYKNENDTDEEVPKMSRDPAGVRRVSGFLLSDKSGRAAAATLRTPRAPSGLGGKYKYFIIQLQPERRLKNTSSLWIWSPCHDHNDMSLQD